MSTELVLIRLEGQTFECSRCLACGKLSLSLLLLRDFSLGMSPCPHQEGRKKQEASGSVSEATSARLYGGSRHLPGFPYLINQEAKDRASESAGSCRSAWQGVADEICQQPGGQVLADSKQEGDKQQLQTVASNGLVV